MFWDKAAFLYDFVDELYNGDVNRRLVREVAELIDSDDRVLECACGTGMISKGIGPECRELIATDCSVGMLKQARKNTAHLPNVKVKKADIMHIKCKDGAFDKVVAGNVIHLLEDPYGALAELLRVCKTGGTVIIPTYINHENTGKSDWFIQIMEKIGAGFRKHYDFTSYQNFFIEGGFNDVEYKLIAGRMPSAVAIIKKEG